MSHNIPENLRAFFDTHPKLAIAFSGGCDSAFLLDAALEAGCDARAYYVRTAFQPAFELEDARNFCAAHQFPLHIIESDILCHPEVAQNPADRCYHCKRHLFTRLIAEARASGYETVCEGTNASDDISDRPGYRALQELGVLSPLKLCGLTKPEIRRLSAARLLPTATKPACACLATRIPTGTPLTRESLQRIDTAETRLRALGFRDFRVRCVHNMARIQLTQDDLPRALTQRQAICDALSPLFDAVLLDLAVVR